MSADAKIRRMQQVAAALRTAAYAGANAYANVMAGERPIVDRHFTAGNQQRYGWAPLSKDYFDRKAHGIASVNGAAFHLDSKQMKEFKNHKKELAKNASVYRPKKGDNEHTAGHFKNIYAGHLKDNRAKLGDFLRKLTAGRAGSKLDSRAEGRGITGATSLLFGAQAGVVSGKNLPMLVLSGALRSAVVGPRHSVTSAGDTAIIHFRGLPDYAEFLHDGTPRMPARSPVTPGPQDREEVIAAMSRDIDKAMRTGGAVPVSSGPIPGRARMV